MCFSFLLGASFAGSGSLCASSAPSLTQNNATHIVRVSVITWNIDQECLAVFFCLSFFLSLSLSGMGCTFPLHMFPYKHRSLELFMSEKCSLRRINQTERYADKKIGHVHEGIARGTVGERKVENLEKFRATVWNAKRLKISLTLKTVTSLIKESRLLKFHFS